MQASLLENIRRAHGRSVPLIGITTSDPSAVVHLVTETMEKHFQKMKTNGPMIQWDIMRGVLPLNDQGGEWIRDMLSGNTPPADPSSPLAAALNSKQSTDLCVNDAVKFLEILTQFPEGGIAFFHQAHRWLIGESDMIKVICQGIANLRNEFKSNNRLLILLSSEIAYPPEICSDIMAFDDPLPSEDELRAIVKKGHQPSIGGEIQEIKVSLEHENRAIGCLSGLSHFAAEQAMALAVRKNGVDTSMLREIRRSVINQTPGLKVYNGKETFDDVAGVEYMKGFMTRIFKGKRPPNLIVQIDEIEKAMAAVDSDSSGTSQDQLATLLQSMEDNNSNGLIAYGPPGCTKSFLAKSSGNTFGVDMVQLDLGGAKGSLVGQSESQIREALKVINALSGGNAYYIATSNKLKINSALMRRFTHGVVFFDLPTEEERTAIWKVQIKAYNISAQNAKKIPKAEGWSAAEIRNCCSLADQFGCTLLEASKDIIPVSVSDPESINGPRSIAYGRFKNASDGQVYSKKWDDKKVASPTGRAVTNLDD